VSEVIARVTRADGTTSSRMLTKSAPEWSLPRTDSALATILDYARLGIVHIATGADHLLFLAALACLAKRVRAILLAETAFTLSHTLTLTASTLGWVHVPSAVAETGIAVSLVLMARDVLATRKGERIDPQVPLDDARGVSLREPWTIYLCAFGFGLIHGLGFAGGLSEIGLPDRAIGQALVGFACGVEVGQVAFLVAFVGALRAFERLLARHAPFAIAYAVGTSGAYLVFDHAIGFFSRGAP
jgi:hypothetical protein